jgi:hypothetical protein
VHAGMHVREAAAIGVERDPRTTGPSGQSRRRRGRCCARLSRLRPRHVGQSRGLRGRRSADARAFPWQRKGDVLDHQVVDVVVRDAGLGAGNAEARAGRYLFRRPRDSGGQGQQFELCNTGFPLSRLSGNPDSEPQVSHSVVPAQAGTQGFQSLGPGPPLSRGRRLENAADLLTASFAGMTGEADHRRLDTLAGADEVDRPPIRCQRQAFAGSRGRDRDKV